MNWRSCSLLAGLLALVLAPNVPAGEKKAPPRITWKKITIDRAFRSEGVAVADVNKDGKMDILVGDVWYEGPDFKKVHRIRPGKDDYTEGDKNVYSKSFACWAEDLNGDGWPDLIVIGFPGEPCHWYENPQNKPGLWKEHVIWHSACNETPQYADLFGTGKRVLIMGWQPPGQNNMGQMSWFAPGPDPTKPWDMHPISAPSQKGKEIPGTQRFSHGLGVGDLNKDGKLDVICTGGWWEQPAKVTDQPWTFHPAGLGPDCADMVAYDVDGDGIPDVISTSAHGFGFWWHRQTRGADGASTFVRRDLLPKSFVDSKEMFSQTHALHCVDLNGDGLKDLVTGRRWWAHGVSGDPGSKGPAVLYWFEAKRNSDGTISFVPHKIDEESGIGTQFAIADLNDDGLLDIIVSNKKGVFALIQVREPAVGAPVRKD